MLVWGVESGLSSLYTRVGIKLLAQQFWRALLTCKCSPVSHSFYPQKAG